MLACTDECLHIMFISHCSSLFTQVNIDYYVISSLMKGFRNVLSILTTKPKFQILREMPEFNNIIQW